VADALLVSCLSCWCCCNRLVGASVGSGAGRGDGVGRLAWEAGGGAEEDDEEEAVLVDPCFGFNMMVSSPPEEGKERKEEQRRVVRLPFPSLAVVGAWGWPSNVGARTTDIGPIRNQNLIFWLLVKVLWKLTRDNKKIKIVRPNRQSNLGSSCQSIFSLSRHPLPVDFPYMGEEFQELSVEGTSCGGWPLSLSLSPSLPGRRCCCCVPTTMHVTST